MALAESVERWVESMRDLATRFLCIEAEFDGSREAFIADGGDPAEIRRLEEAFGVG